jgi:hypothetical protein
MLRREVGRHAPGKYRDGMRKAGVASPGDGESPLGTCLGYGYVGHSWSIGRGSMLRYGWGAGGVLEGGMHAKCVQSARSERVNRKSVFLFAATRL